MVTDRQRAILDYLRGFVDEHGYPPTVREIGEAVGLRSPSTVHAHLAQLERAGLLRRDPTKPRALELIGRERSEPVASDDVVRLPLVGEIAAGGPLLAAENIEDYVPMPTRAMPIAARWPTACPSRSSSRATRRTRPGGP